MTEPGLIAVMARVADALDVLQRAVLHRRLDRQHALWHVRAFTQDVDMVADLRPEHVGPLAGRYKTLLPGSGYDAP